MIELSPALRAFEEISSDMVDRVAMAIASSIDDGAFYNAPAFQKAARAAIEAMREPITATENSIGLDWKLPPRDCPDCRGGGRVGPMACFRCGATGVDPVQIVARD
jgi:hypothetical protein